MIASLDGYNALNSEIVEIKCSKNYLQQAQAGVIPPNVYAQLQHQMMVVGADLGYFVAYFEFEGALIPCPRDQGYQQALLKAELEFLESLKLDECPYSTENEFVKIDVDDMQSEVVRAWIEAKAQLEEIEQYESALRSSIISMGDDGHCELVVDGVPTLRMQRVQRDGSVDWKKLCKDQGISAEMQQRYRKQQIGYYKLSPLTGVCKPACISKLA